jgi:hypothetical protein
MQFRIKTKCEAVQYTGTYSKDIQKILRKFLRKGRIRNFEGNPVLDIFSGDEYYQTIEIGTWIVLEYYPSGKTPENLKFIQDRFFKDKYEECVENVNIKEGE